jgi:ubiquinone/menaquinone biosynthesis C-methylase UbiE
VRQSSIKIELLILFGKIMNEVNKKQKDFWSGKGGDVWVEKQDAMDNMLEPLGKAALNKLPEELEGNLLDIGCGCGSTALNIANNQSKELKVTGVDISRPMIDQAIKLAKERNVENIDFKVLDVQTELLSENFYSFAFSRFGVMFFEDPIQAFQNINRSLKVDANLAFVCWQSPKLNPWQSLSMQVIKEFVDLPTLPERSPGPFAFEDIDYLRSILVSSNFRDIKIESYEQEVTMFSGKSLEEASRDYLSINPTVTEILKQSSNSAVKEISKSLESLFERYSDGNGLHFESATWIVSAKK